MKKWYADDDLAIFFSETPDPDFLFPDPSMSDDEIENVTQKPFLNKKEITVTLFNHRNKVKYEFKIPENYRWDGASIPRIFWRLIGAKTDPRFLIPSMVHDTMCENKAFVNYDRYFSTCVFERMLRVSKVPAGSRWIMKHGVDNYQKFQGWRHNQ